MSDTNWFFPCRVERVIDADTLEVTADLGFAIHYRFTVRLDGLDAPERNTPEGRSAWRYVDEWVFRAQGLALPSEPFPLTIDTLKPRNIDKYGRWLGHLYAGSSRLAGSLNEALLADGHAVRAIYR